MNRRRITADAWRKSTDYSIAALRDIVQRAKQAERREQGHDCGHQFTFTFTSIGHSSGVTGEDPPVHSDSNWASEPSRPVTVRAHNLRDALLLAALTVPIEQWFREDA